jgi:hypothetical protein
MNKTRNLVEMGEFYSSTVLTESLKNSKSKFPGKDTFTKVGKKVDTETVKTGKAFNDAGPVRNNKVALVKPQEPDTDKETFTGVEKFSQVSGKKLKENINTFMNKSIFDRLYEDVMSDNINSPADLEQADAEALELPGTEVEEGEVTITLDRELAKKLHDVLMSVLDSEEEAPETEEDDIPEEGEISDEAAEEKHDDEDEEHEDEEHKAKYEATELTELPASRGHALTGKNNKVHGVATSLVSKDKGEGKVKGEIDAKGSDLSDSKGQSLQSKNNKVTSKTSKVGSYLAGLK